jgi:hypothetical protein
MNRSVLQGLFKAQLLFCHRAAEWALEIEGNRKRNNFSGAKGSYGDVKGTWQATKCATPGCAAKDLGSISAFFSF